MFGILRDLEIVNVYHWILAGFFFFFSFFLYFFLYKNLSNSAIDIVNIWVSQFDSLLCNSLLA